MPDASLFKGSLVYLAPGRVAESGLWARWQRDSQWMRLLDSEPPRPQPEAHHRKEDEGAGLPDGKGFGFCFRTLADDQLVGFVYVGILSWVHRDAIVAIGIGDRALTGKGYGTDAMRLTLRYAFAELDLHRVTLNVFSNNVRAIRSYEKAGFRHEGRLRQALLRDGARLDIVYMGILRDEWLMMNPSEDQTR
jgi:RimJ/RimL family protein N-acetyltransferase